ncbi:hypothetical protein SAMN05216188_11886 [Lentzea xinjiangensis]|uniref:Uncharacterized protein n=1 Tax=Lentzea xinjiangensis TaxID=402600 RepID=A0A1H9TFG2_9PSEU|nr:hypothetical protein [Lentzea xinjiangensis]SER95848.1 hypothetical protein SAMN05216188_11886 [Lentzea xinjiangensis]
MDRATYLDNLVPLAVRLVCAVHDEGPAATTAALDAIAALDAPDDVHPWTALAVTLAAMSDPNRGTEDTLGWVRHLDPGTDALPIPHQNINTRLAIELALAGNLPAHALTNDEGAEVVRILLERGWPENEIRDHLDGEPALIHRWVVREHAARARGAKKTGTAA